VSEFDLKIDALGKKCPIPIIELSRALRENPQSSVFILLSDDRATEPDLIAWARMTGNQVAKITDNEFTIRRS
jgi:TusA-related sulfurtransferase